MSKLVEFLYKKPIKRELKGAARLVYILLGVLAALSLVTAYWSSHQLLHQIGTTAAIVGMLVVGGITECKKNGFAAYRKKTLPRDISVLVLWLILLVIWIVDPQV